MKFNIEEHEKFIYLLMKDVNIPSEEKIEYYHDFVVYFLERAQKDYFDWSYAPTTIIRVAFRSFLGHQKRIYNRGEIHRNTEKIEDKDAGFLDRLQDEIDNTSTYTQEEANIFLQELLEPLSDETKDYLLTLAGTGVQKAAGWSQERAKETGVTRQAVESRVKRELAKIRKL